MDIVIPDGTYVAAISGGVDSMVLLDLLVRQINPQRNKLIVAHFDHGIRHDSALDRELVQLAAKARGLQFVFGEGRLGGAASEADARDARYEFLDKVRLASGAKAIITAHHQDDVLETAILNLLRGTNRRGLTSLRSTEQIIRPLLSISKDDLVAYASINNLIWREDSTNNDDNYRRNYVRHNIVSKLGAKERAALVNLISKAEDNNDELDLELKNHLSIYHKHDELNRQQFVQLPHIVAREVMVAWLRGNDLREFDRKTVERLVVAAKTMKPGSKCDVIGNCYLVVGQKSLKLVIPT